MEKSIHIEGMHCASCERLLKMAMEEVKGTKVLSISHSSGQARLELADEGALPAVKKAVEAEGYSVS